MPFAALRAGATAAILIALTAAPITAASAAPVTSSPTTATFDPSERCPATGRLTFRALSVPWWDMVPIRAAATSSSPILEHVAGHWYVRSLARGAAWSKVSFNGTTGWVRTADLSSSRITFRCTPGKWVSNPQGPAEGA